MTSVGLLLPTETKAAPADLAPRPALGPDQIDFSTARGEFTAYAAAFNNEDLNGDIIEPGAFAATLADAERRRRASGAPLLWPILWMHHEEQPIGAVLRAREDAKGLWIVGRLDVNIEQGKRAYSGMKAGYATNLSIGYDTVKSTRDGRGVRHLKAIRLWEVSMVTSGYAANDQALVDRASVKTRTRPTATATDELDRRDVLGAAIAAIDRKLADLDRRLQLQAEEQEQDTERVPTRFDYPLDEAGDTQFEQARSAWLARHYRSVLPRYP